MGARAEGETLPLTVRIPAEVHQALAFASMHRKVKKDSPWTQQDIVADALRTWLGDEGFLEA